MKKQNPRLEHIKTNFTVSQLFQQIVVYYTIYLNL